MEIRQDNGQQNNGQDTENVPQEKGAANDDESRVKKAVASVRTGVGSVFSVIAGSKPTPKSPAELLKENKPPWAGTDKRGVPLKDLAFPKSYTPPDHPKEGNGGVSPLPPSHSESEAGSERADALAPVEKPHAPRPTATDLGISGATAREREVIEETHRTSLPHTKERIENADEKPKTAKEILLAMTSFLTGKKVEPPSEERERAKPETAEKVPKIVAKPEDEIAQAAEAQARMSAKESTWIRPLRTYKSDVAEAIKKKKTSFVSMVAAEAKKREASSARRRAPEGRPRALSASPKMKLFMVGASITLFFFGTAAVFFFAYFSKETSTIAPAAKPPSHVFTETESEFALGGRTGTALASALSSYADRRQITLNTIEQIILTKETVLGIRAVETANLFTALDVSLKESAIRSLSTSFTFGIHAFGRNQPFLVFSVDSFELAFRGMLDWEPAMNRELAPLFGSIVTRSLLPPSEAGMAPPGAVSGAQFVDRVIKNKDTRILLDENGRVALLYSFIDRNTLVVTGSTATFEEIVTRYSQRRVQ